MALIKCTECGKVFSDKADKCPNCGCPVSKMDNPEKITEIDSDGSQNVVADSNSSMPESETNIPEGNKSVEDHGIDGEESNTVATVTGPKKNKKVLRGVAIGIVAIVAVGIIVYFATANIRAYNKAINDYDAKNYETALQEFNDLGDYKDSSTQADACTYQLAASDFEAKKYQDALEKYKSIEDFKDSKEKAEECNYQIAADAYENEEFQTALEIYTSISDYKDSADLAEDCEYQLSVDGQYLREMAKGLMERWDQNDSDENSGALAEDEGKCDANYCDIELKHIESFYDKEFDNKDLEEDAKSYIDLVRQAKDATQYENVDYTKFSTEWSDIYSQRTILLQKFVSDYKLTVDEKYQDTLDGILTDAEASQNLNKMKEDIQNMADSFIIDSTTPDETGYKEFSITMTNTTSYTFDYFYLDINLLDTNGNIVESGSSDQVTNWTPNQSATVDVYFDDYEIDLTQYTVQFVPHYQSGTAYN